MLQGWQSFFSEATHAVCITYSKCTVLAAQWDTLDTIRIKCPCQCSKTLVDKCVLGFSQGDSVSRQMCADGVGARQRCNPCPCFDTLRKHLSAKLCKCGWSCQHLLFNEGAGHSSDWQQIISVTRCLRLLLISVSSVYVCVVIQKQRAAVNVWTPSGWKLHPKRATYANTHNQ